MNRRSLASKLAEGVAVDAQTISETWLRFKLEQLPQRRVRPRRWNPSAVMSN